MISAPGRINDLAGVPVIGIWFSTAGWGRVSCPNLLFNQENAFILGRSG